MNNLIKVESLASGVIENVIIRGDLSRLNEEQKINYYINLCKSLDLNPMTKPFEYITLNNKLVLYASKACTEQLRRRDGVSIEDLKVDLTDDFIRVTAKARNKEGRTDIASAVVSLTGLKGADKANAQMKCETKAKRRVTLSLCGLGMLDESEVDTIPEAMRIPNEEMHLKDLDLPNPEKLKETITNLLKIVKDEKATKTTLEKLADPKTSTDLLIKIKDKLQTMASATEGANNVAN